MLYPLIRFLSWLVCWLPKRWSFSMGTWLADLMYFIYRLTPYRQYIYNNIQTALHIRPQAAHHMAKAHIRHLIWNIIDFLRLSQIKNWILPSSNLTIKGFHYVAKAWQQKNGVILASAHFGFWELIPVVLACYGIPTHVLVQRPSLKAFDRLFSTYRKYFGISTHYNDTAQGLRPLLKALERGEAVGMVVDQHGETNQLIGTFFGHTISLPMGPAFFARHCSSPVIPVLAHRLDNNRHVIEFLPPLYLPQNQDKSKQSLFLMQEIYNRIEDIIRKYPEEWLWVYNRWNKYKKI